MRDAQVKTGCFILEGLNSFATTFYFYYLYFFMQKEFGFGDQANLMLAALSGLVYMFAVLWGGRFAQRAGCFTALKIGLVIMIAALAVGTQLDSASGQVVVMFAATLGMGFTWPPLEALVSEGETPARLQPIIGLYNVVWAGMGALAYFIGGAMLEKLGLKSLFVVPIAIQVVQLALTVWLERGAGLTPPGETVAEAPNVMAELNPRPIARAKAFLRMAWLTNPFAYIAINTLVAVMPGVAGRLGLSTTLAGFCCSLWCFARLGAFFALWFWPGWHYRFRWLLGSYLALIVSFAVILVVPSLAVLVTSQLVFGVAIGLIYYSSLFYSMDVGETKAEHGGIHEATIGLGNFAGPAVGAAALHFLPQFAHSSAVAVGALLLCGLGGLLGVWRATKLDNLQQRLHSCGDSRGNDSRLNDSICLTTMALLAGKLGLVFGVANKRSIAWAIAQAWAAEGAKLAFTYQGERLKENVEELAGTFGADTLILPCDVTKDEQIADVFKAVGEKFGKLHLLLHSVAFAPKDALEGEFVNTSREAFRVAHDVSAYSLVALACGAAPLMTEGGSIVAMSYYGAEKVVPHYNVMGVAKAALEASTRYLAYDLGPKRIRVNCISAGPVNTLAARGIGGFTEMLRVYETRSPLKRNLIPEELGATGTFLASDGAAAITGQVIYVDCGYQIMGM